MATPYAGNNITGTSGIIAVDKVGNHIRFYDPDSLRETRSFPSPEPTVHELAISHHRRLAFVPLYGDGIYGSNRRPNNKVLVIDLVGQSRNTPFLGRKARGRSVMTIVAGDIRHERPRA